MAESAAELTVCFAGVLRGFGVGPGDRVVIYLPMIPEAVVAMLACARLGAVHSVVFGGFAPRELAVRIDDARPKVVVTASCGIEPTRVVEYKPIVDRALEMAEHQPDSVVLKQRPQVAAEMRARQYRTSGLVPSRRGFHHEQPPRELLDRARDFYGITAALDG